MGIKIANDAQLSLLTGRISKISAKDFDGDDHWVKAEDAESLGIIDGIIGKENLKEDSKEIKLAAQYILGGIEMDEKVKEEVLEKEEEQAECGEEERKDEPQAEGDMDIMEAIVERLGKIEERLSVLESEGKTQEDYDHDRENASYSASARRKALLAKLSAVCAPVQTSTAKVTTVQAETVEDRNARCKAVYKNFDALMADFIKRK
jgi:hypothetical protein